MNENVAKNVTALHIQSSQIPSENRFVSTNELWNTVDKVPPGEFVSILNRNNLSEVLIYQRTKFSSKDESFMKWDGESSDSSWYDEDKNTYEISDANQLAAFRDMVNEGNNFDGKTIVLTADIDLNHKEWEPIGVIEEMIIVGTKADKFYKVSYDKTRTFCGTFDGNNHVIRGLNITKDYGSETCVGFFRCIHNATIKNLIFDDAMIGCEPSVLSGTGGKVNIRTFYAVAFGYAELCVCTNIITCGIIHTRCGGGIGVIAEDTSIVNCVNRCTIIAIGSMGEEINVGGIVQQYGLSPKIQDSSSATSNMPPTAFMRCIQSGQINLNPRGASYISSGHLYGKLAYDPKEAPYKIGIDRCLVGDNAMIICTPMFEVGDADVVFAGCVPYRNEKARALDTLEQSVIQANGSPLLQPSNWLSNANSVKIDLMDGLLGRTNSILEVTVNQITNSVLLDNTMVIPGSVNVLVSHSMAYSFNTVDANALTDKDSVLNLEPYFSYIKKVRS